MNRFLDCTFIKRGGVCFLKMVTYTIAGFAYAFFFPFQRPAASYAKRRFNKLYLLPAGFTNRTGTIRLKPVLANQAVKRADEVYESFRV